MMHMLAGILNFFSPLEFAGLRVNVMLELESNTTCHKCTQFLHLYVFSLTSSLFTYSSVRKLVKLSAVQFMLNNHTVSTSLAPHMMGLPKT